MGRGADGAEPRRNGLHRCSIRAGLQGYESADEGANEADIGKENSARRHPVLRWMADNIFIRTDPAGNIKADKEKSTEKIDGVIALIMALDRAIRCENDTSASVYDERGILLL